MAPCQFSTQCVENFTCKLLRAGSPERLLQFGILMKQVGLLPSSLDDEN